MVGAYVHTYTHVRELMLANREQECSKYERERECSTTNMNGNAAIRT